jgi:release factor glutamine methyltransferase
MTIQQARQTLLSTLQTQYDQREAANIADIVLEHVTGWTKIDRVVNKHLPLLDHHVRDIERYSGELATGKPMQYVLQEAWFMDLRLFVNEHVLIPRPETEELVTWIIEDVTASRSFKKKILDIGTGSGCIPISLKKKIPEAIVLACDISVEALQVAKKNAENLRADVNFINADILDPIQRKTFPSLDIIVSNPPYIPLREKETLADNVRNFEPQQALFVNDDDPFLFYRAIADTGNEHLVPGGKLYVEIHEDLSAGVVKIFSDKGYNGIGVRNDMQGKERMVTALKR